MAQQDERLKLMVSNFPQLQSKDSARSIERIQSQAHFTSQNPGNSLIAAEGDKDANQKALRKQKEAEVNRFREE